jgi:hypothetical protein
MTAQIGQMVRELLAGDLQSYPDRTSALDEPGWNAFGEIVGAAFYSAVGRKFGTEGATDPSDQDIPAFVVAAAAAYEDTPVAIDTAAAEALIRSAMGDEATVGAVLEELDEPDLARIELVLLRRLLDDGGGDLNVEELVTSAQDEAAQFSGEAGSN